MEGNFKFDFLYIWFLYLLSYFTDSVICILFFRIWYKYQLCVHYISILYRWGGGSGVILLIYIRLRGPREIHTHCTYAARNNAKYVSEALIYLGFHKSNKKKKKRVSIKKTTIKTNTSDTAEECVWERRLLYTRNTYYTIYATATTRYYRRPIVVVKRTRGF